MKAPLNRRVFVIGYGAATPLGRTFPITWERAVRGEAGFRKVTRCQVESVCNVVGEIPDWDPLALEFVDAKEAYNWNAAFVLLTMAVCHEALAHARLPMDGETAPRTACLIGSAINGVDAFRTAMLNFREKGPLKISPYLLPNLCANLPSGKAGMLLGFTGPVFSPQGACASGNHAVGIGARMIRDGDCDFVLAGGVDTPILPEIIHGFANMNATVKVVPGDRAHGNPAQASRPFSVDRRGFVVSEGAGCIVIASRAFAAAHGLGYGIELAGWGMTADAHHVVAPNPVTVRRCMQEAIRHAGIEPADIDAVNAHAASTKVGDRVEADVLQEVFDDNVPPVSAGKSQLGHAMGASSAIESILAMEGMRCGVVLPTINHRPDPDIPLDCVAEGTRALDQEFVLKNAFGFGGCNACLVFRRVN